MRILIGAMLSLLLISCASGPGVKKGPSPYSASWEGKTSSPLESKACTVNNDYLKMNWKALVVQAGQCVRSKNYFQVERVANQLAKVEPESHWGAYYLSISAEYNKDLPRAFWMINLALKKAPEDGISLFQRGRLYWGSDQKDLALDDLKEAVKRNPSITEAHLLLAQVYFTLDESKKSKFHFEQVLARNSKHPIALFGMGELSFKQQSFEQAYSFHKRALSVDPRLGISYLRLAQVQELHQKDYASSLETYKDLLRRVSLNRVDGKLPIDVSEKVKSLNLLVKQSVAQNKDEDKKAVSQREPTGKKVSK